jgi:hypothetical protein
MWKWTWGFSVGFVIICGCTDEIPAGLGSALCDYALGWFSWLCPLLFSV